MPVYEYSCDACGVFNAQRPMAEYLEPHACPGCGTPSARVLLTAPGLAAMDGGRRAAFGVNERSAHAPQQAAGHTHGPHCGCGGSKGRAAGAAKSFPATRPWMISH
jgi:putative FmdB family regulatory protein